jgi:ABC-type spermidine/putrescine transport system permease subunit I
MEKSKFPNWLRQLFIALPLGIIIGAPVPIMYFLSEHRDWGRTYENYSDFVTAHVIWAAEYSFVCALIAWLILLLFHWFRGKSKTSAHQVPAPSDHE